MRNNGSIEAAEPAKYSLGDTLVYCIFCLGGGFDVQLDPGQKRQEIDLLQVGVQFDMNI